MKIPGMMTAGWSLICIRGNSIWTEKRAITSYVRYRDEEGDIGRIERQQKFMKALMDKVTSPSIILQLPSILREVLRSVKTDLRSVSLWS